MSDLAVVTVDHSAEWSMVTTAMTIIYPGK